MMSSGPDIPQQPFHHRSASVCCSTAVVSYAAVLLRRLASRFLLAGRRLCFCLVFLLAGGIGQGLTVSAAETEPYQESQSRYFQGLRERQLYELLELLCQQKLQQTALSDTERRFYQVELARTFALHAQQVPLVEAEELWTQAEQILQQIPADDPIGKMELALLQASQAEQLYWISLPVPENRPLQQRFQQQALLAVSQLTAMLAQAGQQREPVRSNSDFRLTDDQLQELQFALVRTHLRLVEIFRWHIPEKTLHLQAALEMLPSLARRSAGRRWGREIQLLQLVASRLSRSWQESETLFKTLNQPELPDNLRLRFTAEYARHLLAEGQATAAAELILKQAKEIGSLTTELEALRLQALLEMATVVRSRGEETLATELETEVQQRLTRLEQQGERYQALLVKSFQQRLALKQKLGPELANLTATARQAASTGEFEVAAQQYAQILKRLREQGQLDIAMELVGEAVQVDFQKQDYAQAAHTLEQLWRSSPALPGMEQVHLQWIQALGRDYMAARDTVKLNHYLQALQDHQERYAGRETYAEAVWLQGELQFARMQVTVALELYQEIAADPVWGAQAQLREGQCYQWIIQRAQSLQQPPLPWEEKQRTFAQQVLEQRKSQPIVSPATAELLLLASRILLEDGPPTQDQLELAQKVLQLSHEKQTAPELTPAEQAAWKSVYQAGLVLRGVTLAQAGQVAEAEQLLLTVLDEKSTPADTLFLAGQLAETKPESPELAYALAELLLKLTAPLEQTQQQQPTALSPADFRKLKTVRAEAFLKTGQITPAIHAYETLLKYDPGQPALLQRLTELYTECNNAQCAEKCYQMWQQQTARKKQGTTDWLTARYHLARWAKQTGRTEEARKIVQVTLLLYPTAGTPELQQQYRQLASELKL